MKCLCWGYLVPLSVWDNPGSDYRLILGAFFVQQRRRFRRRPQLTLYSKTTDKPDQRFLLQQLTVLWEHKPLLGLQHASIPQWFPNSQTLPLKKSNGLCLKLISMWHCLKVILPSGSKQNDHSMETQNEHQFPLALWLGFISFYFYSPSSKHPRQALTYQDNWSVKTALASLKLGKIYQIVTKMCSSTLWQHYSEGKIWFTA